ncbi:hypothetical protein ACHAXR_003304 [Thalassiosira sp. AJA248-18]
MVCASLMGLGLGTRSMPRQEAVLIQKRHGSEAYRPVNINKQDRYWGEAYPGGVNDQNTVCMIDIHEAGFKLESKDRKRGKVTTQRRADARGKYKKGARGHPVILDLIEDAGHRLVFRAPYWSCDDGAIEYVFNTIHVKLQMNDGGVTTVDDLINEIDDIIFGMVDSSFYPYFQHVGFPSNSICFNK